MKVSVVVPIYNIDEMLLRRCIDSILDQTEKDIEVILVDDGSKNNALEVCNTYKNYENLFVIHQENAGVSVARNTGVKYAKSDWIMFVDPDDYLHPSIIENLLNAADNDDDVVACCCYDVVNNLKSENHYYKGDKDFSSDKTDLYHSLLYRISNIGAPWGKIYRHSFLDKYEINFKPELRRAQDIVFNLYCGYYSRCFKYIDIPLYYYNNNHINSYHDSFNEKISEYYYRFAVARYNWMKEFNCFDNIILRDLYCCGASQIFKQIIAVGAFHRLNKISLVSRFKSADLLLNEDCFSLLKNNPIDKYNNISLKQRFLFIIIERRLWFLLYFYVKFNS